MVKTYDLIEYEKIRIILCQYLRVVLRMSVKNFVKLHPGLKTNMFYRSRKTQNKRNRSMDISSLDTLCKAMDIKLFVQEGDTLIKAVELDLTNPQNPMAVIHPLVPTPNLVAQPESYEVKTLATLVKRTCNTLRSHSLVMQLEFPDPIQTLPTEPAVIAGSEKIALGYVRSLQQYNLLLEHGVYYIRTGAKSGSEAFFADLPHYLIVFPSQWLKGETAEGIRQYTAPYSIRIFKIRQGKDVPHGPANNEQFARWHYTDYNASTSHAFVYLESEVSNLIIDQAQATTILLNFFNSSNYAPVILTYSALLSHQILRKG